MIKRKIHQVAIIGAGPAGITAAIQLCRYDISTILFEKERIGGLLYNANLIENYPGFPKGITGPKLVVLLEKQLENLKIEVKYEKVIKLDYHVSTFCLETENNRIKANRVIVASGTKPRAIPIPMDISIQGQGKILSDVYPLLGIQNKDILIIGAGDAAFDYALNLGRRNKVTILNRGRIIQSIPLLQKRVFETKNISYIEEVDIIKAEKIESTGRLRIASERKGERVEFVADFLLFAVGRVPNLSFLSDKIRKREKQLVKSHNLYFVGDVRNGLFRQTAIAAGDGLRAAMEIINDVTEYV